ncbi:MAG: hypothetical protein G01um101425_464 [Candidatus Peregrinibacteria bacterium Gr01-1014_25]|nr:MAG: hypothetical protein G01um101425_464 [Candidatus Peregrinibacteria bacterium Gr01-1014_25]
MATRRLVPLLVLALLMAPNASLWTSAAFARATECADAMDNDRDGFVDYPADPDCDSRIDDLERPTRVDLSLSLTDGNQYVARGELMTYTMRIKNNLTEAFVSSVRVSLSNLTYLVDPPASAEVLDSRNLRWKTMDFKAGEEKVITFTARVVDHTPNGAAVIARLTASNLSTTDMSIVSSGGNPPPALTATITDGETEVAPGGMLTYHIVVRNASAHAATNVQVSASMPIYGDFLSATDGGTWDGRNVRWRKVIIAANDSKEFVYIIGVRDGAPVGRTLLASVAVGDSEDTDATTIVARTTPPAPAPSPEPDINSLIFRMSSDRSEVLAGGTVNMTVALRNTSGKTLENLIVTAQSDPSLATVSDGMNADEIAAGEVVWRIAGLSAGDTWQGSFVLAVKPGAAHGSSLGVSAQVSGADVAGLDMHKRSDSVNIGVMRQLPQTGMALDVVALIAIAGLAAFAVRRQRKAMAQ